MGIFQRSVLNKYLKTLDEKVIDAAYKEYREYFNDKERIENIRTLKEENYQEGFLREVFVDVLGFTINPNKEYNLTTEYKNETDSKKADGAIIKNGVALAVIELKSTKTIDMKSIEEQAFNYKRNHKNCRYVITSNFEKIYFYIDDYSVEYEEFNLFEMDIENFKRFYLTLSKESIFNDIPLKIKDESKIKEIQITNNLYKDYSTFKHKIFENMTNNNPQYDKLLLLKKSQKLLDRLLFIFFAEDRGLLPPNMISKIIDEYILLKEQDEYKSVYTLFCKYFKYIDEGIQRKDFTIPAYNGELFKPDEVLNNVKIDDEIIYDDAVKLSSYDFQTDVDVDILGHIFENSLNDIEELHAEVEGIEFDKTKTKRKKEGVFYTPKYITRDIVENTLGALCDEKKKELKLTEIDLDISRDYKRLTKDKKELLDRIETYKNYLLGLKILDPACGSGAFLIQALDYLIKEHQFIEKYLKSLTGDQLGFYDIETSILEKNIYGVDINDESVEIAKLSLWLRTAEKGRKLNDLSKHIKCGNSLIDDPAIAGDKAFKWEEEFPEIMAKKEKIVEAFHITWVTHNSRISERMIEYNVKKGEPFVFTDEEEIKITEIIKDIVIEDNYKILAYNIYKDHIHILLVCNTVELPNIIRKLKGKSSQKFKEWLQIPSEEEFHLWAQKYDRREIKDDNQFVNTINYINNNREKHQLSDNKVNEGDIVNYPIDLVNKGLQPLVDQMTCNIDDAFNQFEPGGFDVVIGNPPYVVLSPNELNKFNCVKGNYNTYVAFIEKSLELLKIKSKLGFIIPNTWFAGDNYNELRNVLINEYSIEYLIQLPYDIFQAYIDTSIIIIRKQNQKKTTFTYQFDIHDNKNRINIEKLQEFDQFIWLKYGKIFLNKDLIKIGEKVWFSDKNIKLGKISKINRGSLPPKENELIDYKDTHFNIRWFDDQIFRYEERILTDKTKYVNYESLKENKPIELFKKPKILARQLMSRQFRINMTYIEDEFAFKKNLYAIYDIYNEYNPKYILTILNSKIFSYCQVNFNTSLQRDDFPAFSINDFREFFIPNISLEKQKQFIHKAEIMISLNKSLNEKLNKFLSRIKSNFNLEKITGKLEDFYLYEFKDFNDELAKQKIKLSLKQQDEWEDYFKEYKAALSGIKNEIDRTDREIDRMVYELYGLTDDEIKIVEGEK